MAVIEIRTLLHIFAINRYKHVEEPTLDLRAISIQYGYMAHHTQSF
jgi:hypothetical protein